MSSMRWLFILLHSGLCLLPLNAISEVGQATKPINTFHDSRLLEKAILNAYRAGAKTVVIPPGTYYLTTDSGDNAYFHLSQMKNFEIDATNVLFIGTSRLTGFVELKNCDDVTIRGATFRHDPTPFSQGKIEAISKDRSSVDIRISAGYPKDLDDKQFYFGTAGCWFNVYDPKTRDLKPGCDDLFFKSYERLGADTFRFHLNSSISWDSPVKFGDLAAWRGKVVSDIVLLGCQNMKFTGLRFQSAGGFVVFENAGNGGNYYNYRLERGPTPDGATERPLLSSNADAFHSDSMRRGPTLEKCFFECMDDDGIPIHGSYVAAFKGVGNSIIVANRSIDYFRVNDTVHFYDENGTLAGEAKIKEISQLTDYIPSEPAPAQLEAYRETPVFYASIKLDRTIVGTFPLLAVNFNALGNGFVIRDCVIQKNRSRGILIKASDGLIENCVIDGACMGGIVLCPEMSYWAEADYSRRVLIRHNIIRRSGLFKQQGGWEAGALTITEWQHDHFMPAEGGHKDIQIENNTFENNDGVNVLVSSAKNILFANNQFVHPMWGLSQRGTDCGVDSESLYWITEADGVLIKANKIIDPGPYLKTTVKATASVENLQQD
jgi:hypothetical protein